MTAAGFETPISRLRQNRDQLQSANEYTDWFLY